MVTDGSVHMTDCGDLSRPEICFGTAGASPDNWLGQLALQLDVTRVESLGRKCKKNRPKLPPRDRVHILLRDNCRCVICRRKRRLEVGHLISVAAGRRVGLSEAELYSSENLAAMCRKCNRGLGADCPPVPFLVGLLRARLSGFATT